MSRGLIFGLLLALLAALALRCPQLDIRPMHNDEAVNAIKLGALWERGVYHYDPQEYHGPTLPYLSLVWMKLTGAKDFAHFSEAELRGLTVLFGLGLILLLPLVADGLGRQATVGAALLTAISPAMVFYSRYYIHEMLLVFFTLLALAAGWRYTRSRKVGWALLAGAAVGLMQATKETFVLALAAMAVALILNRVWNRSREGADDLEKSDVSENKKQRPSSSPGEGETLSVAMQEWSRGETGRSLSPHPGPLPWGEGEGEGTSRAAVPGKIHFKHILIATGAWLAVVLILFTSFFTNAGGLSDSLRTYLPWLHRAGGASPHIHPWNFYLERLAFFQVGKGPVWSEGLILGLAIIGLVAACMRKGRAEGNAAFIRFVAFYTIILTVIYCAIGYKTPWCLLGFWQAMIMLAGVGICALIHWLPSRSWKIAVGILLLAGAGQLAFQAWRSAVPYAADPRNPYVYAQTSPDLLNLVERLESLAQASPQKNLLVVKVMAPAGDYWPLPWYLRRFTNVGWWSEVPPDAFAPMMIVSTKFQANLDAKKTHLMAGLFELRPQSFFELYVATDLWRSNLDAAKHNQ